MGAHGVVVSAPSFDEYFGFEQGFEDFSVEEFAAQSCVKRFDVAVFPGTSGFDVGGINVYFFEPVSKWLCNKFRAVVGPNVLGSTAMYEELCESIYYRFVIHTTLHINGQAFSGEFIDDIEHSNGSPIVRARSHEIVAPPVVFMRGGQADTRAVVEPQSSFLRLLVWHFQALSTPQSRDAFRVHFPAIVAQ